MTLLNIHGISERTGDSPQRIRVLRVQGHELYSQAWKTGTAQSSPLKLESEIVDKWVAKQRAATTHSRTA